uniref:Uncharacterized protein n=1 Tax=Ditylenchus dipsaci TaxID=166011 RepID=A0A915E993_9BILA
MVWGEEFDQRHRTSTSSDDDSSVIRSSGSKAHGHPKYSLLYGEEGEDGDSINGEGHEGSQSSSSFFLHHWHSLLDSITDVQLRKKFLPLPRSKDGVTVVGEM